MTVVMAPRRAAVVEVVVDVVVVVWWLAPTAEAPAAGFLGSAAHPRSGAQQAQPDPIVHPPAELTPLPECGQANHRCWPTAMCRASPPSWAQRARRHLQSFPARTRASRRERARLASTPGSGRSAGGGAPRGTSQAPPGLAGNRQADSAPRVNRWPYHSAGEPVAGEWSSRPQVEPSLPWPSVGRGVRRDAYLRPRVTLKSGNNRLALSTAP